jgi:hypothetical protein
LHLGKITIAEKSNFRFMMLTALIDGGFVSNYKQANSVKNLYTSFEKCQKMRNFRFPEL